MDQFPGNSRSPVAGKARDEPKKVERVVQGDVVRRKTPIGKRFTQNVFGGDAQSVWGYVFGDVLLPAARDMVADAVTGGVERMIFGDHAPSRGRSRSRGGIPGHTDYRGASSRSRYDRDEPRRDVSSRGRRNHSFDEIVLPTRVEAEEVLDRLDDLCRRYDTASVMDLYGLLGITSNYTDDKWGWTDLRGATVSRVRGGYLLNLPRPEPID